MLIRIRSCRSEARRTSRVFSPRYLIEKPLALLAATAFATSATASFMAYHFHDLSPYVLIGNPLTLTVIEVFAVPGALLGGAALSAGARRAGVELCRGGRQLHPVGCALHRAGARFDGAFEGVRALCAAVSSARGDERHHLADVDVQAQRHSARSYRGRGRNAGATL